MTGMKHMQGPIGALAFVGILAGCSGAATTPSNALLPAAAQMQPAAAPIANETCPFDKGVSVKPCAVKLRPGKSEVTVTTKGPLGGKFTVTDPGCKTRSIATIKGSGNTYKVSAGADGKGQCVATFIDYDSAGKRLGAAKVIIVNGIDKRTA